VSEIHSKKENEVLEKEMEKEMEKEEMLKMKRTQL
jgi:hypothetical protein